MRKQWWLFASLVLVAAVSAVDQQVDARSSEPNPALVELGRRLFMDPSMSREVKNSCADCHESHGSANAHLLLRSGNALCSECHSEVAAWQDKEVQQYENTVNAAVPQNGTVIIGTFSENGPLKCSGIEIKQYAKEDFLSLFAKRFELVDFINTDHDTPFDTVQNFNFAVLQKRKA